jgi:hypothetical protein
MDLCKERERITYTLHVQPEIFVFVQCTDAIRDVFQLIIWNSFNEVLSSVLSLAHSVKRQCRWVCRALWEAMVMSKQLRRIVEW